MIWERLLGPSTIAEDSSTIGAKHGSDDITTASDVCLSATRGDIPRPVPRHPHHLQPLCRILLCVSTMRLTPVYVRGTFWFRPIEGAALGCG